MRSFLNVTMFLALLPTACGGGSDNGGPAEGEAEAEGEGDDPCLEEGCETEIVCSADRPCPNDDPCRPHRCDTASATCRWNLLDSDGDGFAAPGCDGRDCNDDNDEVYPGAPEECNGEDDDCDGKSDEDTTTALAICFQAFSHYCQCDVAASACNGDGEDICEAAQKWEETGGQQHCECILNASCDEIEGGEIMCQ